MHVWFLTRDFRETEKGLVGRPEPILHRGPWPVCTLQMTLKDMQWVVIASPCPHHLGSDTSRCRNRSAEERLLPGSKSHVCPRWCHLLCSGPSGSVFSLVLGSSKPQSSTVAQARVCEFEFFVLTHGTAAWCYSSLSQLNTLGMWGTALVSSAPLAVPSLWEGLASLLDRSLFLLPGVIRNIPQATVTRDVTVLTISGKILGLLGKFLMMISA